MLKKRRIFIGIGFLIISLFFIFLINSFLSGSYSVDHNGKVVLETRAFENKPNIVLIVTDDQRWDTLQYMPNIQNKLVNKGITFKNAFVSTPNCCPYRASLLSGGYYPHNNGVLTNNLPNGGAAAYDDKNTIAVKFQKAGYRTALFGKYLNKYQDELMRIKGPAYVPPGWSTFNTMTTRFDLMLPGNISPWSQFEVVEGSSTADSSASGEVNQVKEYYMDYYKRKSISFIENSTLNSEPFLLILTPLAPHDMATPAKEDEQKFSDFVYRDRGYFDTLIGKPSYVQELAKNYETEERDRFYRNQLRSLQSVDRAVGDIVDKITSLGIMDNTLIIFTSDNGYMWGEHGLTEKNVPYEESIRVPLIIAGLSTIKSELDDLITTDLDLGETLLHIIGESGKSDGQSLVPFIQNNKPQEWKDSIILQDYNMPGWFYGIGSWLAVRSDNYKYVYYPTKEEEFYDLKNDPYELINQISNPDFISQIQTFKEIIKNKSNEIGLTVTNINHWNHVPDARIGLSYAYQLHSIGGNPPVLWEVVGQLPGGITLDKQSGLLYGSPTTLGDFDFNIAATDSSQRTYTSGNQRITVPFKLKVQSGKAPPPLKSVFTENFENIVITYPISSTSLADWQVKSVRGGFSIERVSGLDSKANQGASKALKVVSERAEATSFQLEKDFGELVEGNLTLRFYDNSNNAENMNWGVSISNKHSYEYELAETRTLSIGFRPEINKKNYVFKAAIRDLNGNNIGNDKENQWMDTGIPQTQGWHSVTFWVTRDGAFALLDNQDLRILPVSFLRDRNRYRAPIDTEFTSFRYFRIGTQNGGTIFLDDISMSSSTLPPIKQGEKIDFSRPVNREY